MRLSSGSPLVLLFALSAGCSGKVEASPQDAGPSDAPFGTDGIAPGPEGGSHGSDGGADAGDSATSPPPTPTSKLDILFAVQNSASMVGVGPYVQASVQAMFDRLVSPNCIDGSGSVVGVSSAGVCATGSLEFQPVSDIHIGIVTTSLGGRGSDQCADTSTNPANPSLSAHADDHGELINRTGANETPLSDASPSNFLAWFPSVPQNAGKPAPPVPAIGTESQLVSDFQGLLADTGVYGCGFTAPLEAWYRFLVQPDPYKSITLNGTKATYTGIDATILQQRHDFLRPDSALAIVLVAVENDRSADSLSVGGQGWAFESQDFPGSPSGAAPEGTIECQTNPEDPNCTSCAFLTGSPNFATECPKDGANGTGGYLDPADDALNVRFFHMKQRFGLDPQFPLQRYVTGLQSATVPDGAHEHDSDGNYAPTLDCTNPMFATGLPTSATASTGLCNLAPGPRQPSQVFFTVIGGVPHQLLQASPGDGTCATGTAPADCPQKPALSSADWTEILGADPLDYDFTGADFHMLESENPRPQSPCPPSAADDCDPINGREWTTNEGDLQFACIFRLAAPIDCSQPANLGACACAPTALGADTQLCERSTTGGDAGTPYTETQVNGAAYPTIRALSLAKDLGAQGVVSSVCPIHVVEAAPGDPLYAYRPAFRALIDRVATTLVK
ncbi:MAG TPA: hypothetical protein VGL81_04015 [Polyangiaceae bacterium]|jgi:hypothetical protein